MKNLTFECRKSILFYLIIPLIFSACADLQEEDFTVAIENGKLANESYSRSLRFVKGWLPYRDSISGLLPSNLTTRRDIWDPHNAAADNYAFMVLTCYLLDRDLYNGPMLDILHSEISLTSRIKSLPDTYQFSKRGFKSDTPEMGWIIFGASEYMKDGLLPLTEYMGESPFTVRMLQMLNDLSQYFDVLKDSQFSSNKAVSEEVNGEMLQTLSRIYWMTGDEKYLNWAIKIGDYYLIEGHDLSQVEYLRLRDHGCEVIGGLSELYVTLNYVRPEKKEQYKDRFYKLLDRVLEVGRNPDGLFYNAINVSTGEVVDEGIVDNWGYIYDAYYSVYLVDGREDYRQAFLSCIQALNEKYRDYPWEGKSHDGYADALESGINLYNREPVPALKEWIDSEIKVMWGMQKEDGIIGGWHGDGNFARTAIMYALWKTQGIHCYPRKEGLTIGAERKGDTLFIAVSTEREWEGELVFDYKRHKEILHLPIDYPRINQFPEWFTVDGDSTYQLVSSQKELNGEFSGKDLTNGLPFRMDAGARCFIVKK